MEPITTELRRSMSERSDAFTGVAVLYCEKDKFIQLCDAIDAVHARLEQENDELGKTVYDMRREFDEWKHSLDTGWIRLPADADGEYIHIGDVMEWVRYKDDDPTIVRTVSGIGNGVFFAWSDEQGRYAQYEVPAYRHHHAPTVEDLIRDAILSCIGHSPEYWDEPIAECATKLQLKEDE